MHERHIVRQCGHIVAVMGRKDQRATLVPGLGQPQQELVASQWIEARDRLVQDQYVCVARHREQLQRFHLLATRQTSHTLIRIEMKTVQQFRCAVIIPSLVHV
jgi:hypothetical protein